MTVTHTAYGYTGTVDEVAWPSLMAAATPRFRVASSTDWALSVSGTTARTINIAAGSAYVCGVRDVTTAGDTVSFAANSGGSNRYDALVARFIWGSDTVAFVAITGTTSPPAVNTTTTVDNTKINRIPGTQYDALLAVVQVRPSVGNFSSGDLFDMRLYGGISGPAMLPNSTYLSMVDGRAGAEVYAVDAKQRWITLDGSTWIWPPEAQGELGRSDYTNSAGTTLSNSLSGLPAFDVLTSYIPPNRRIEISFNCVLSSDTAATAYTFILYEGPVTGGTQVAQQTIQMAVASIGQGLTVSKTVNTGSALTNQHWTLAGKRETASGTFSIFARSATEGPAQLSVRDVGAV